MSDLKTRVLEALMEDWKSPSQLAVELGVSIEEIKKVLEEVEEDGLVFRDGPLYLHRLGRR